MNRVAVLAAVMGLWACPAAWSADAGAICHTPAGAPAAVEGTPASADAALRSARELMRRGAWDQAICDAGRAAQAYRAGKQFRGEFDATCALGVCYQALGRYQLAIDATQSALTLTDKVKDRHAATALRSALGALYDATRNYDQGEIQLSVALATARRDGDARTEAGALNNLGNLHSDESGVFSRQKEDRAADEEADRQKARELEDRALSEYQQSARSARRIGDALLEAKAVCNAAVSASRAGLRDQAAKLSADAAQLATKLPDSHEKAYLLIAAGRAAQQALPAEHAAAPALVRQANDAYAAAIRTAKACGDGRAESYATGYQGSLYETDGNPDDAIALTERAIFLAQRERSDDALYRWESQLERLLRRKPDRLDRAIEAGRRAVGALSDIHTDVALGYGNGDTHVTFRQEVAPVYFQLADLLLWRAPRDTDSGRRRSDLVEARQTVEKLKQGELEDYLQDRCTNQNQKLSVTDVGSNTALVYIIPLPNRVELLLDFGRGTAGAAASQEDLEQVTVPGLSSDELEQTAVSFRSELERRESFDYKEYGDKLYQALIKPIRARLDAHHVHTLVFVPDGALRLVPMAALWDEADQQFLIQQYAVAVTPGLTLMEPRPLARNNVRLLLNGLSVSREGYPALPAVRNELSDIRDSVGRSTELLDQDFVERRVKTELSTQPAPAPIDPSNPASFLQKIGKPGDAYSIVHIASHGEFRGDVNRTFVLAYDDRLTLDTLQKLITPASFSGHPIELLCLSACKTASGDDRAALGLAGVAVKAGARSAIASLWAAQDKVTAILMSDFYRELLGTPGHPAPRDMTKAEALRRAQVMFITNPQFEEFSHPRYWAPFLVIGNWL